MSITAIWFFICVGGLLVFWVGNTAWLAMGKLQNHAARDNYIGSFVVALIVLVIGFILTTDMDDDNKTDNFEQRVTEQVKRDYDLESVSIDFYSDDDKVQYVTKDQEVCNGKYHVTGDRYYLQEGAECNKLMETVKK